MTLREANTFALDLIPELVPFCNRLEVVGSVRRKEEIVNDIDMLIDCEQPNFELLKNRLKELNYIELPQAPPAIAVFELPEKVKIDFYTANENTWGILELLRTGPKQFNMLFCGHAQFMGCKISGRGYAIDQKGIKVFFHRESEVFNYFTVTYILPEERGKE